jgi:thiaminase
MSDANQLIETIRNELSPLGDKITHHRYLEALEAARVAPQHLRIFAEQQYHIIVSDLRSVATLLSRHGNLPSRPYLLGLLQGENTALEMLGPFATALEMSIEELRAAEPIPAAFAYSAFVAWLAHYGSDAELAAGFAVNLAAWGANCGRMSKALRANYRFTSQAVSFFDLFADLPPIDDAALAVIQGGLERGVPPSLIARAARLLQGYEIMYWDSMAEAAGLREKRHNVTPF